MADYYSNKNHNHQDPELLDDDGRPKRTGNVWTASAHIITAVIGAGVLALAWAVAQLGWIVGPIMMIMFSFATYYTSTLLADCYRNGDPLTGTRNYTYVDAIRSNLGGFNVKLCGFFQYLNLYGLSVGYTIAAASSLVAIQKGMCLQRRGGGSDPCNVSNTPLMIGFGVVQILLSQIPGLDQIWWLSIIATIMSFTYSSIGLILGIAKVAATGVIKGSLTGVRVGDNGLTMNDKIWQCCQALGNIAFAYTFSNILIEIQNTVRSPPSETKTMKKATLIGVSITSFFYLLTGCFGYAAFGDHAPENLIGDGFLKPYWVIHVANFAVLIHMFGAYQIYCQPIFFIVEKKMASSFPKNKFINNEIEIRIPCLMKTSYKLNLFRIVFRTLYVISTTFLAKLIPYFGSILGLLGAFAYWPLTVYFPIEMYIVHMRVPKWSPKWIGLKVLSAVFLLIAGAAAAGSIVILIANFKA
ncbi:amino acid permease 3-like [Impatiens glandulifera]|uniref:amino acid permease 3-like n=1 Tax=Impatiens glandulifera TaxID=253017 RepID=UPI001FB0B46C|nr:amino acid permease 3-like [Impatiens glandulifera]